MIQLLLGGLGLISSTQMFSIWRYVVVRQPFPLLPPTLPLGLKI